MAMTKALWALGSAADKTKARGVMLEFLKSEDRVRREEGALALGEIGAAAEAKPVLLDMRGEPTERGRSAAFLLDLLERQAISDAALRPAPGTPETPVAAPAGPPGQWPLLDEIRAILDSRRTSTRSSSTPARTRGRRGRGHDEVARPVHRVPVARRKRAAARVARSDLRRGRGLRPERPGQLAAFFTISRPIWGGPIYRAGLRSGDVIVAVDGNPTPGSRSTSACAC